MTMFTKMRKYFLVALILAVGIIIFPAKTQAQYNPFIYNNNAYLTHALARSKARAKARSKRVVRKKTAKRKVVRRSRRVSLLENLIDKRETPPLYSKKSEIV